MLEVDFTSRWRQRVGRLRFSAIPDRGVRLVASKQQFVDIPSKDHTHGHNQEASCARQFQVADERRRELDF